MKTHSLHTNNTHSAQKTSEKKSKLREESSVMVISLSELPQLNVSPLTLDLCHYFIFSLFLRSRKKKGGWFSFNSTAAKDKNGVYCNLFAAVKDALIEAKVIQYGGYAGGLYSSRFRFTPAFENGPWKSQRIIGQVAKRIIKKRKAEAQTTPAHQAIYRTLKMLSLDKKPSQLRKFSSDQIHNIRPLFLLNEIAEHAEPFFKPDLKAGRLHHSLTQIKRSHRNRIKVEGQRLWQIDVSSCQPFLLWQLVKRGMRPDVFAEYKRFSKQLTKLEYNDYPYVSKSSTENFGLLAKEGGIYQFIEKIVNGGRVGRKASRAKIKRDLLRVLFWWEKPDSKKNPVRGIVRREFPELYQWVIRFNEENCPKTHTITLPDKSKKEVRLKCSGLAILLQRLEAFVILHVAANLFVSRCPSAPLISIHDSLATTEDKTGELRACLEEAFLKTFGEIPHLKDAKPF